MTVEKQVLQSQVKDNEAMAMESSSYISKAEIHDVRNENRELWVYGKH